jgi:hypothetical protein
MGSCCQHATKVTKQERTLIASLGDVENHVVLKEALHALETQLVVALRPERRVCCHCDAKALNKVDVVILCKVRMQLDLHHLWLDTSILKEIEQQCTGAVAKMSVLVGISPRDKPAHLIPMFLVSPSSTRSSIAFHVSCRDVFSDECMLARETRGTQW